MQAIVKLLKAMWIGYWIVMGLYTLLAISALIAINTNDADKELVSIFLALLGLIMGLVGLFYGSREGGKIAKRESAVAEREAKVAKREARLESGDQKA